MFYYQMFVESVFKIIFFIILFPFKVIDVVVRYCIAIRFFFANKELTKKYLQLKTSGIENDYVEKELFLSAFDFPPQVYWRKFRNHKYHRYIVSIIFWTFLIIRLTVS